MKVQWEILLFMFCLNLAFGLVIQLNMPGTLYVRAAYAGYTNATEYEEHFNATAVVDNWKSGPFSGIPMIGDIFAGAFFLWQNIEYLIDGFPAMLIFIDTSYITSSEGHATFFIITSALRAVYALMMVMFIIELISGRDPE